MHHWSLYTDSLQLRVTPLVFGNNLTYFPSSLFCRIRVNSKELRRVVEEAIEEADVKPNIVRFFRGAMFNMINIALSEVDVVAKPSRCTFSLAGWLEERNRDVMCRNR